MKQRLHGLAVLLAVTCALGVGAAGLATAQQVPTMLRAPRDQRPGVAEVTGGSAGGLGVEHAGLSWVRAPDG